VHCPGIRLKCTVTGIRHCHRKSEYTASDSLAARFVHGTAAGVDDPLVWYGGGENRRLHADHQGSIVAVTDGTGAIKWINGYDEWGIPNAPSDTGRFQYTGSARQTRLGVDPPVAGRFDFRRAGSPRIRHLAMTRYRRFCSCRGAGGTGNRKRGPAIFGNER
jgi:hypothetical protein